ncbi:HEAT repeat domain-containing protein [Streptomyces lushanensis]|uniref:HEAT repeat domain-containing protein n=1 Tax=Streptomyces lushanensis TaxID=1434255 RepID=UPI0008297B65|nr:hypothetical protein [Streptomyces lushanensis]
MNEFDNLIQQAMADEDAEPAVRGLVEAGPEALRQVMEYANEQARFHLPALYDVIRRSTYPDALPILLANAGAAGSGVMRSVFYALARSEGVGALDFVVERLTDVSEMSSTRAAAAEALHGSSSADAREALSTVLAEQRNEPDNPEWPLLLVNTVTALATMNDHSGATALYPLFDAEHDTCRALAVGAFRIVFDQHSLDHLSRALDDPSAEVRRAAVDPLFLIGSPKAAGLLLQGGEGDEDHQVRYNSTIRFGDIMGLALGGPEDLPFAREKWREMGEDFAPAICYRFGEPISLDNLVEEFIEEEDLRGSVAEELRLITGIDVPSVYLRDGVEDVQRTVLSVSFTDGRIYKWGYAQPMPHSS